MSLIYLKEDALTYLKSNISTNVKKYYDKTSFLENYFLLSLEASDNLKPYESIPNLHLDNINLINPSEDKNHEILNSIALHSTLSSLTPIQASDERIWVYLAHVNFWTYMKNRWPIENLDNDEGRIRDRYFFTEASNRGYIRHGIGRLWWYGYYAYDPSNNDNPYWLMETLFKSHIHEIIERSLSHNKNIVLAILKLIKKIEENDSLITHREKSIRPLIKYLNQRGGATVLDMFDSEEIQEILMDKYQELKDKEDIND